MKPTETKRTKVSIYGDFEALVQLGQRIKERRLEENKSQEHMAKLAGISRITLRKIENGNPAIQCGTLARILGIMGFAGQLAEIIPPSPPPIDLKALKKGARQRAGKKRTAT
jgi:transcriptional regulator with XRE-family HTH domain